MFGAILKATYSSFQKGMTFCRSISVKKVMKLLAFIFKQPSYACMEFIIATIYLALCVTGIAPREGHKVGSMWYNLRV